MSWSRRAQLVARALTLAFTLSALPTLTFADTLTLEVPALGASAMVEPIEIVDDNLGTPLEPNDVGALQLPGNLLVVGHRDWSGELRAFSRLNDLQRGDVIQLSDGRAYGVEATNVWDIDGDQDAWHAAVAPTDGDVLTLISCTGAFSIGRHEYLQRIVVRADRID
jgi:sortase (surface protein transpeptidase)